MPACFFLILLISNMRSWKSSTNSRRDIWSRWLSVEVHLLCKHEALCLNAQYLFKGWAWLLTSVILLLCGYRAGNHHHRQQKPKYNCTKVHFGGPKNLSELQGFSKEGITGRSLTALFTLEGLQSTWMMTPHGCVDRAPPQFFPISIL